MDPQQYNLIPWHSESNWGGTPKYTLTSNSAISLITPIGSQNIWGDFSSSTNVKMLARVSHTNSGKNTFLGLANFAYAPSGYATVYWLLGGDSNYPGDGTAKATVRFPPAHTVVTLFTTGSGSWNTNTTFSITYDGMLFKYYMDNLLVTSSAHTSSTTEQYTVVVGGGTNNPIGYGFTNIWYGQLTGSASPAIAAVTSSPRLAFTSNVQTGELPPSTIRIR